MTTITADTQVADIARRHPSTIKVLQGRRLEFCCGGKRPLGEACAAAGLPVETVVDELRVAAAGPQPEVDWGRAPLSALVGHIVGRYHQALRRDLPVLRELAAKVAARHGAHVPALLGVREVVDELAAEMIAHMEKEEVVLFPMVLHLASDGDLAPGLPADAWEGPVTAMEGDHDEMARLLDTLRVLTGDFTPPADACNSFRGLYQALADLEAETQLHVHLENNVLFPRLAEELGTVPVAAAAG